MTLDSMLAAAKKQKVEANLNKVIRVVETAKNENEKEETEKDEDENVKLRKMKLEVNILTPKKMWQALSYFSVYNIHNSEIRNIKEDYRG